MLTELRKVYSYIIEKRLFFVLLFVAIVSSGFSVLPFYVLGLLVDGIGKIEPAPGAAFVELSEFGDNTISLAGIFVLSSVLAVLVRNVFGVMADNFATRTGQFHRDRVFAAFNSDREGRFSRYSLGDKVQRTVGDTQQLENGISYPLTTFVSDLLDVVWITFLFFLISLPLVLVSWLLVPPIFLVSWRISRRQASLHRAIRENESALIEQSRRAFSLRVVIHSLRGVVREEESFKAHSADNRRANVRLSWAIGRLFVFEGVGRQIGFVLQIVCALLLLGRGLVSVGEVVTIVGLGQRFFTPIGAMARYFPKLRGVLVSIDRIEEITSAAEDRGTLLATDKGTGFSRLVVSHPVIRLPDCSEISIPVEFSVGLGELVVVCGKSGLGKTSLLMALQGVSGSIVSGVQIQGPLEPEQLPHLIHYVAGNSPLLTDSALSEVCYPNVCEGPKDEHALQLLENMGLASLADLSGDSFSPSEGERVRLILCRSLYISQPIILIDEPFNNLDEVSLRRAQKAILDLSKKGKAVVVVSHIVPQCLKDEARLVVVKGTGEVRQSALEEAPLHM